MVVTIPDKSFFKIGEVAKILDVKPHIVRYWESEFRAVRPAKTRSGQRLFRRKDIEHLLVIRSLVHEQRFTVEGARRHLKELADAGIHPSDIIERVAQGVPLATVLLTAAHPAEAVGPAAQSTPPVVDAAPAGPTPSEIALRERLEVAEGRLGLLVAENAALRSTLEMVQARAVRTPSVAMMRERWESLIRVLGPRG